MSGIFNMITDSDELKTLNRGISKMSYHQVAPTRDVTTTNFSNGQISIKFSTSGATWWIPSRTYLRFRVSLMGGTGNGLAGAANIAPNMDLCANLFQSCEFKIQDKTVSRVSDFVSQVDALNTRLNKSKSYIDSVLDSVNYWEPVQDTRKARVVGKTQFELIWTPPLSIFGVNTALPAGDYELILNPFNSTALPSRVIESDLSGATKAHGAGGDFQFQVDDMYLYVCEVLGPRSDNMAYYLDLDNIRCQSDKVQNTSFQSRTFSVEPSTNALTVAYQDGRAGDHTAISPTKFKLWADDAKSSGQELALTRMYVHYAGQSLPNPDADPLYTATSDRMTQRYIDTQLYSGALFDTGGTETLTDFLNRGPYIHMVIPRDGSDRSTIVQVHQQFATGTPVTNARVLLFDHYKSVARIEIRDGRIVDVATENT